MVQSPNIIISRNKCLTIICVFISCLCIFVGSIGILNIYSQNINSSQIHCGGELYISNLTLSNYNECYNMTFDTCIFRNNMCIEKITIVYPVNNNCYTKDEINKKYFITVEKYFKFDCTKYDEIFYTFGSNTPSLKMTIAMVTFILLIIIPFFLLVLIIYFYNNNDNNTQSYDVTNSNIYSLS